MPSRVRITSQLTAEHNQWAIGTILPVSPTYQEEQYLKGGYYVNVYSERWKHDVALSPGEYELVAEA